MPATARDLQRFLDSLDPPILRAFLAAVEGIKSQARIAELEAAVQANDADAAFRAAGMRPGSWTLVTEAVRSAYISSGQFITGMDVPARLGHSFNPINPRALEWISTHSADLVVELNLKQRQAIRTIMTLGNEAGRNPRSVALDIVGRVGRTGRRQGGVIGLHDQFAGFAGNARAELQALDPNYFTRTRRDRRYDAMVQRAIDSGKPLDRKTIDMLVGRYEDRLLQTRGTNIARTEALSGMNAASDEALSQVVDEGLAEQDAIERIWDSSSDARVRPDHAAAEGQRRGVGQPFSVGGYAMMHPGDTRAPASQRVNCFVPETMIAVSGLKSAIRRHYSGDVVKLSISPGVNLTVTPNHPILTNRGWVAAGDIIKGDKLVNHTDRNGFFPTNPNVKNRISSAEQLYSSSESLSSRQRVGCMDVNFHGEIPAEDVDVVFVESGLRDAVNSPLAQFFGNFSLADTDIRLGRLMLSRMFPERYCGDSGGADGLVRGGSPSAPFVRAGKCGASGNSFANSWQLSAKIGQARINKRAPNRELLGNPVNRIPGIEQFANFFQKWLAAKLCCIGVGSRNRLPDSASLGHRYAEVDHAGSDNCGASASLPSNSVHRLASHLLDYWVKALSLPAVIKFFGSPPFGVGANANKSGPDDGYAEPGFAADFSQCFPAGIECLELSDVVAVDTYHYDGPVFNFETESGLILANGIVSHNCRCIVRHEVDFAKTAL